MKNEQDVKELKGNFGSLSEHYVCVNMVTNIYDYFLKALSFVPEDFINENITLQ